MAKMGRDKEMHMELIEKQDMAKVQEWVPTTPPQPTVDHQCPFCPANGPNMSRWQIWRYKQHLFFEEPSSSLVAKLFSIFIMALIVMSTLCFILRSLPEWHDLSVWVQLEIFVSLSFTFEYLGRISSCNNILKFAVVFLNVIDLVAIVPFWLELIIPGSGQGSVVVLRVIRLARIFRLFKVSRYSANLQLFGSAMARSKDAFLLLLFFIGLTCILFSSLMYYVERGTWDSMRNEYVRDNGDSSPFFSIPATMWYTMVTMTTVGYGDMFPVTVAGKIIGTVTMIAGIVVLALPIAILGSNFQDLWNENRRKEQEKNAHEQAQAAGMDGSIGRHLEHIHELRTELEGKFSQLLGSLVESKQRDTLAGQTVKTLQRSVLGSFETYYSYIESLSQRLHEEQKPLKSSL
eukprot:GILK01005372.1.p1 GENE.GILK01005372.1~~GILK01005372.1.p1  ORF type:complete len:421 (-),score=59.44 GILK01005372.1:224-1435(-)